MPLLSSSTTDQDRYLNEVIATARAELTHPATPHDAEEGHVSRDLLARLGDLGLIRDLFGNPGGEPKDAAAVQLCLLREGLATVNTHAETALALQGLGSYPILQSGSDAQRDRWMPGVVSGRIVPAFALTEPDAGSDAAALGLRAIPHGDGWVLDGEKKWISNAPEAHVYVVFARTGQGMGARGVSAFVVAGDAPGLSGTSLNMLSPHALGSLTFDSVHVGPQDLLGDVGGGFRVAMRTLDLFRPSVGAFAVGMAQAAVNATARWATQRRMFGGVLADQQAAAHLLAEMATRTHASRLSVRHAAMTYDAGADRSTISSTAAMAKWFATEQAQWVVDKAVQLHGARALERGHLLEGLYRAVRAPRIYEGASEVQLTIIARELLRNLKPTNDD